MTNHPVTNYSKRPSRADGRAQSREPWAAGTAGDGWRNPPADLSLAHDVIHLWRASLECSPGRLSQFAETLSEDEHARARRFHFEQDRNRFIAARGTLRAIIGRYLGMNPGAITFSYAAAGKPAVSPDLGENLTFNVSHANSLALYAVSWSREVGIDVEHLREIKEAEHIAHRFFTVQENAELNAVPPGERMAAFLRVWTRREACLKASGIGIAEAANGFEVPFPGEETGPQGSAGNVLHGPNWSLRDLTPAPGYLAALASSGPIRELSCFHWHWPDLPGTPESEHAVGCSHEPLAESPPDKAPEITSPPRARRKQVRRRGYARSRRRR